MKIREANRLDAFSICKISCDEMGYQCSEELVRNRLIELDRKREIVFVAQVGDRVVGFIHAEKYNTLYSESMVNILGLAVSADYRRNGVGGALLSQAENWAKGLGIYLMRLNSGITRKGAHDFYRAMKYNNEKEQLRFLKHLD